MRQDTTKEREMPQIIVTSDRGAAFEEGAVTFRERVTVADFDSDHFGKQLVERLGWAVGDADAVERVDGTSEPTFDPGEPIYDPRDPVDGPGAPMDDRDRRIGDRDRRISAPSPA
jgi:hypothetical protein